jgi:glutamate synthase domain-containing protein 3
MQMDAHSSPAITCMPDGTYEVAFAANNDGLDIFHTGSTNDATGLGMQSGTSPTISSPYNP